MDAGKRVCKALGDSDEPFELMSYCCHAYGGHLVHGARGDSCVRKQGDWSISPNSINEDLRMEHLKLCFHNGLFQSSKTKN